MEFPKQNIDSLNRESMGLPENKILIGFPHTLFKLHPDFDGILKSVLNENQDIRIVFINTPSIYHGDKVRERWKKTAPIILESSIFFNEMSLERYLMLLANMDFVLDPLYFG